MNCEETIDIASAKERFMGNYGLFSKFLYQFPDRSLFSELEKHIEEGDVKAAFETAHTMKGITANLSLKKVETPLIEVVEVLRAGNLPTGEQWQILQTAYKETLETIKELQEAETSLF